MAHSQKMAKLILAAVIPALVGLGPASSAPSPADADRVADEAFTPGADGIDFAAVTGPQGPAYPGRTPACADPARTDLRPCLK